jgi:hypothetical protein
MQATSGTLYNSQGNKDKPQCSSTTATQLAHLQRAAKGEGEGPGLVDALHLVHGGQVSSGLLLGLATCRAGGGWW